jgi:hypothetical protein
MLAHACYKHFQNRKGWITVAAPGLRANSGKISFKFKLNSDASNTFVLCGGFAKNNFRLNASKGCNTDMALGMDSISWAVSSDNTKGHGYASYHLCYIPHF